MNVIGEKRMTKSAPTDAPEMRGVGVSGGITADLGGTEEVDPIEPILAGGEATPQ